MKLGSTCPLGYVENQREFLITELENFYRRQLYSLSIEEIKKEFCVKICENILC